MKIKDYKCKCGHNDFFFADKGSQKGIYCSYCGKWFKWADKDEQNLPMNQESVLDNINAEIMQVANQEEFHDEKWALGLRYAVKIINKYRVDSEG